MEPDAMIVDFRARPEIEEFASITQNPIFNAFVQGRGYDIPRRSVADMLVDMDRSGIDYAVVEGRDIETTFNWKMDNEVIARIVREGRGRLIGFCGVDPHKGMAAVREVVRGHRDLGLKGVSLDPYMHKIAPDHRLYYPIYAKCVELDIPVVLTGGWAFRMPGVVVDDCHPRFIDRVATEFPELKIVVSHGCYPFVREIVTTAYRHRNVYFEWSGMELRPWAEEYVEAANELVHDKALFASAFPFFTFATMVERYAKLPFKPDVRPKVMGLNAARLLGIAA
jgi:predicted TIM-barrel fold metal-dependent hydrolase